MRPYEHIVDLTGLFFFHSVGIVSKRGEEIGKNRERLLAKCTRRSALEERTILHAD